MKYLRQTTRQWQRIFAALVLASILSLGIGMTFLNEGEGASNISDGRLPESVRDVVLQTASGQLSLPMSQLQITQVQQQTWRDRCLGLSSPIEKCVGTPTPGWRVTVEGRQQFYVYRTNDSGSQIRTEAIANLPPGNSNLPFPVANAVLHDAQARLNLPTSGLQIVQVEPQTWSDGCLGLANPGQLCPQALVPGWRITVNGKTKTLVYRTNDSGSLVRVEETAD
jgi:hypothetical protein